MIDKLDFFNVTPLQVFFVTLLILMIMYTALYLYFEHRADKMRKEWQKKQKQFHSSKKS